MEAGIQKTSPCDADSSGKGQKYWQEGKEEKTKKEHEKKVNLIAFDVLGQLLLGTLHRNFRFSPTRVPSIMFRRVFTDLVDKRLHHPWL